MVVLEIDEFLEVLWILNSSFPNTSMRIHCLSAIFRSFHLYDALKNELKSPISVFRIRNADKTSC